MEFGILGPLEVRDARGVVALGGVKPRAVLAVLLLHANEAVSAERLALALWGEDAPAGAVKTVQVHVSRLRKALGDAEVVATTPAGYRLRVRPGELDVERFELLVEDGRRALAAGQAQQAAALLREALSLWRGSPLDDLAFEPFAQAEIARLEEQRLAALEARIEADLAAGRHGTLLGELQRLVTANPTRERLTGQLMLALYRCGRQAEALEAYRTARRVLVEELGIEPGRELRGLHETILRQDAWFEPPPTERELPRELDPETAPPLVGPDAKLVRLWGHWERASKAGALTHDPALEPPTPAAPVRSGAERSRAARGRALIAAGGALLLAAAIAELTASGGVGPRAVPNSVAAIDTRTNRVVGQVAVGARPSGIAFGSGSLWVANLDDQTVSRVDPRTLRTLRTLSVGGPPTGIAAAGGRVWVVRPSPTSTFVSVSRIDPQFDVIDRTVRIGNVVPGSPGAVAARGATLWVAPFSGALARLDPSTGRVVKQLDPNAAPAAIDLGADAVWLTDSDAGNVTRVDPTGLVTSLAVGHGPSGIAVGDGGVWVADTGDDAVVRIDPSTRAVTATIPVGDSPAGVSLGAGSVWVANGGDGTVTRIDPVTERAIVTIAVGGSPQAITVAGGRAWVTVDARTIPATRLAAGDGTARLDSKYYVTSMDPALANDELSWQLLYATCAKLLNYPDKAGPAGSQLVPEVAQSLPTRSADGKSYTFTIRNGFRFSPPSNEPVTAQTFKDTIERTLNPRMRSSVARQFRDIVGARAYMAGRSAHIAGVVAGTNTLTIRLIALAPDLPARTTEPAFCAVPSNTPIDPEGVRSIPSAGPYRVASYTPRQGVVLTRNPNYRGSRPHRLAGIELALRIPTQRAVAQVEAGTADYAVDGVVGRPDAARLAARYGPGSPAARRGRQQYFVNAQPQLDFLALNTHRPLFADVRLRRAVNYAIDRAALARLGDGFSPLPEHPTDHYLPPGVPGYSNVHIYPSVPDLAKARQLANGRARTTAVLYTCDVPPCDQQAQIIKTDLAAIGLRVEVKAFPDPTLYPKLATHGEPFDITTAGWLSDYPDPRAMLNVLLEDGTVIPTLNDPTYRARLAAAARLAGAKRYLTYARLDTELARHAAPLVAYGNASSRDLFSARMGCQLYGVYGIDLAALCITRTR